MKIIPLDLDNNSPIDQYPLPININAAVHECKVLKEISALQRFCADSDEGTGFARLIEICVVEGKYPNRLVSEWKYWTETRTSENNDPGNDNLVFIIKLFF